MNGRGPAATRPMPAQEVIDRQPIPYANLYSSLLRIRRVEEEIARVYPTDKIKSPVHLSIGQEAVSVGVCTALQPSDTVFGTYRGHALYLAKGGDLRAMIAELYGKVTGCAKGKGGSMHLVDTARGVMGTSAVVATTVPNAVGYAFAQQYSGSDRVVVSFFGDGALEEGVFQESLNFAALKRLPILFVCENNQYAIHSHQSSRQASLDVVKRVRSLGVPASRIEDNDVLEIFDRTVKGLSDIRSGAGPAFLECMTYRWREHVGPSDDFGLGYRSSAEAKVWMETDQIRRLASLVGAESRAIIEADIDHEIEQAFCFAESSPFPEPAELYSDVFAEA